MSISYTSFSPNGHLVNCLMFDDAQRYLHPYHPCANGIFPNRMISNAIIEQTTVRLQLRMKHDDLSCALRPKNLQCRLGYFQLSQITYVFFQKKIDAPI